MLEGVDTPLFPVEINFIEKIVCSMYEVYVNVVCPQCYVRVKHLT